MSLFDPKELKKIMPLLKYSMAGELDLPLDKAERGLLPTNERAKIRYAALADQVPDAIKRLQALPGNKLDFSRVGLSEMILRVVKGDTLRFEVPSVKGSEEVVSGAVVDIGAHRLALLADQKPRKGASNFVIESVGLACYTLSKLEIFERALFPHQELEESEPTGPSSRGGTASADPQRDSYRDFVQTLIEQVDKVHVNPAAFRNPFDNYQIYEKNGFFLAYNPEYKSGVYISPRFDDFFMHSKRALQRMDDVIFIVRNERNGSQGWQQRIRENFLNR